MRKLKKSSKVYKVLKFVSKNEPVKTSSILKKLFTVRMMSYNEYNHQTFQIIPTSKSYKSYPGWSGTRAHLTYNNGYNPYPASMELTKQGYILTEFGRQRLKQVQQTTIKS